MYTKAVLSLIPFLVSNAIAANFGGPDSVENTIESNKNTNLTERLNNYGITVGADYFALGLYATAGSNGDSVSRSSGIGRFYGQWDIVGEGTSNTGGLVWKVEHRHSYSNTPPKNLAFIDDVTPGNQQGIGYIGMIAASYSDQNFRVSNLHWKQRFNDGNTSLIIGWQDVTDYVDTYALGSPWTGFTNLAFSTGAGAMGLPDDGILAISAGHMFTDNFYGVIGIADANGKSDDIFDGFNTAFNEREFFSTLELGWTASQQQIYTDNVHITLWDFGENTRHSNYDGQGGRGINFSASWFATQQLMPFVRGGVSEGDVGLYDSSLSLGFGYFGLLTENNNLGFAINFSEPNQTAFSGTRNQFTSEVYYNISIGNHLQITPDIQYIKDPALSSKDSTWVFGLRARVFI